MSHGVYLSGGGGAGLPLSFGSGADGAFAPSANTSWTTPAEDTGYILKQFTSFDLPQGVTLSTTRRCQFVLVLVDGDVNVRGTINGVGKAALGGSQTAAGASLVYPPIYGQPADSGQLFAQSLALSPSILPRGGAGGAGGDVYTASAERLALGGRGAPGHPLGGGEGGGGAGILSIYLRTTAHTASAGANAVSAYGRPLSCLPNMTMPESYALQPDHTSSNTHGYLLSSLFSPHVVTGPGDGPGSGGWFKVYTANGYQGEWGMEYGHSRFTALGGNGPGGGGAAVTSGGSGEGQQVSAYQNGANGSAYGGQCWVFVCRRMIVHSTGRVLLNGGPGGDGGYIASGYYQPDGSSAQYLPFRAAGGGGGGGGVFACYHQGGFDNQGDIQVSGGAGGAGGRNVRGAGGTAGENGTIGTIHSQRM